ncbi:MAG TPA: M1 family metallopeptidase [Bacteroidales bacterium]|nr:M1 family metallopeptidase [Bacteroidales bacterium]
MAIHKRFRNLKEVSFLMLLFCFITARLSGQVIFPKPLSPRTTGYDIKAKLDTREKKVHGEMTAFWVNQSGDVVKTVRLHMYMNAFRNKKSTFYRESNGSMPSNPKDSGWVNINIITDKRGNDLSSRMKFISPDDANPYDMTVTEIELAEACNPGDTVFLNIDFTTKLPSNIIRTGYSDNFYFVAQWFPKFGVYEPAGMRYALNGSWNCHQFHRNSEFYSNHSVYDVSLTVPSDYVVGSGGMLMTESTDGSGNKTLILRAEDIVDFAWTAWPEYAVFEDQWKHVKIRLLMPPERKGQTKRQMQAVKNALEYLDEHVGPYPWPYVTVVDPPMIGAGASGMEYTTLFTSQSSYIMPEFIRIPEMVTIHEFGHSYFMGILASNEFEEPWLDEGVNTYWEERIIDHYYGGMLGYPIPPMPDRAQARMSYVGSENRQAVSNAAHSWKYPHSTYGMMSYQKTGVILQTLEGIIGEEMMDRAFREYYSRWAFKHPSGKDFINVVNEVVTGNNGNAYGPDLNWFFSQTLYGTGICDYRVSGLKNYKEAGDSIYRSVAEIERIGEVMLPVDILVHFEDGKEIREKWDGLSRVKDFEYTGKDRIEWVKIDPEFRIRLDVNYINNSMTTDFDDLPLSRMRNKLIAFLQFFLTFFAL